MKFNDAFKNYVLSTLKNYNLPFITVSVEPGLDEDEQLYKSLQRVAEHITISINSDVLYQAHLKQLFKSPINKPKEEFTPIPDVFIDAFTEDENLTLETET